MAWGPSRNQRAEVREPKLRENRGQRCGTKEAVDPSLTVTCTFTSSSSSSNCSRSREPLTVITPSRPMLNQPGLVESGERQQELLFPVALAEPPPLPPPGDTPVLTGNAVGHWVIDAFVTIHSLYLQHRRSLCREAAGFRVLDPFPASCVDPDPSGSRGTPGVHPQPQRPSKTP